MSSNPTVSVIIPAFNQAGYLGAAIESVLEQVYQDWELIIVDDGSTDKTAEIIHAYTDSRIHYIYQSNRGLPGARNTGIRSAKGELFAFLDADDFYSPQKLLIQVSHLENKPEVGLSYSSRISIDEGGNYLRLKRPPVDIDLSKLVLGFPFTINDILIRRNWIETVGCFDESFRLHSEDRNFYLKLALAGCCFDFIQRAWSYRRVYFDRTLANLDTRLETMLRALDTAFIDSRCPPDVLKLKNLAQANDYLTWSYQAALQSDALAFRKYLLQAITLNPDYLVDQARSIHRFYLQSAIADGADHIEKIERIYNALPDELTWLNQYKSWAQGMGFWMRAARDIYWGRVEAAQELIHIAQSSMIRPDDYFFRYWTDQILQYDHEFGSQASEKVISEFVQFLKQTNQSPRVLLSLFYFNRARNDDRKGNRKNARQSIMKSFLNDPTLVSNRGALSILFRSFVPN